MIAQSVNGGHNNRCLKKMDKKERGGVKVECLSCVSDVCGLLGRAISSKSSEGNIGGGMTGCS